MFLPFSLGNSTLGLHIRNLVKTSCLTNLHTKYTFYHNHGLQINLLNKVYFVSIGKNRVLFMTHCPSSNAFPRFKDDLLL